MPPSPPTRTAPFRRARRTAVARRDAVVHVMGWRSQQYGSFERFLVALAAACREAGLETHLVFPEQPASAAFAADVGAPIHHVPSARNPADPRFAPAMARLLREVRPTHLHAHFGLDAYESLAVAAALGVPHRFTTKHIVPSASAVSKLRHRALGALVERFFTVSQDVGARLVALGVPAAKVQVVHLGVDPDAYRPDPEAAAAVRAELGLPGDSRIVLSTSHLRDGKGVDLLPELAAALARDPGAVVVLAAGDGVLREPLAAQARGLGLRDDAFRLLGVREDVPRLLAAADVFVFPTVGAEGFGLGPIEALAAGRPVVSSAVGDLRASLDGVAELVEPGDAAQLLAAVRRLLADPARATQLGMDARRHVIERFSAQSAAQEHVRGYLAVAGSTLEP